MTRGRRCDEVGAKQMGGREGTDAMRGGVGEMRTRGRGQYEEGGEMRGVFELGCAGWGGSLTGLGN